MRRINNVYPPSPSIAFFHNTYLRGRKWITKKMDRGVGFTYARRLIMEELLDKMDLTMVESSRMYCEPGICYLSFSTCFTYNHCSDSIVWLHENGWIRRIRRRIQAEDGTWYSKTNKYYPGKKLMSLLIRYFYSYPTDSRDNRNICSPKKVTSTKRMIAESTSDQDPQRKLPSSFPSDYLQKLANMTPDEKVKFQVNLITGRKPTP